MLTQPKKLLVALVCILTCLSTTTSQVLAASKPPAPGETLPPFKLAVPGDADARSYLGLSDVSQFTVPQIEAQVVIIEIFNMY